MLSENILLANMFIIYKYSGCKSNIDIHGKSMYKITHWK
jgi:hypothetical protein